MQGNYKGGTYQKYLQNIVILYKQRQDLRSYLEILLSVVTIIIFVIFAIKPTLVTITDLITKIQSQQETSNKLDEKIKNLGTAQNLYAKEESKINILQEAVPDNPDVAGYIRQIEGLIKKENLTTLNLGASQVDLTGASVSAQILGTTISVSGDHTKLENLMKNIENLRRPSNLIKISESISENILNLTITGQTPYMK